MAAVGIAGIEEVEAAVIALEQKGGESSGAGLVGASSVADGSGAHGEAAGADSGFAEDDGVVGLKFLRSGVERCGEGGGGKAGGADASGRSGDEISAIHAKPR